MSSILTSQVESDPTVESAASVYAVEFWRMYIIFLYVYIIEYYIFFVRY